MKIVHSILLCIGICTSCVNSIGASAEHPPIDTTELHVGDKLHYCLSADTEINALSGLPPMNVDFKVYMTQEVVDENEKAIKLHWTVDSSSTGGMPEGDWSRRINPIQEGIPGMNNYLDQISETMTIPRILEHLSMEQKTEDGDTISFENAQLEESLRNLYEDDENVNTVWIPRRVDIKTGTTWTIAYQDTSLNNRYNAIMSQRILFRVEEPIDTIGLSCLHISLISDDATVSGSTGKPVPMSFYGEGEMAGDVYMDMKRGILIGTNSQFDIDVKISVDAMQNTQMILRSSSLVNFELLSIKKKAN